MTTKQLLTLLTSAAFVAGSMQAAIINVTGHSFTPDGSTTLSESVFDVGTPNGGNVLPNSATQLVYAVTTFNFGTGSNAHLRAHFVASLGAQQDRLGIEVNDDGLVSVFGGGPLQNTPNPLTSQFDLAQDMAGQSISFIMKYDYDINRSTTSDDDTLFEVWVNPTGSSLENAADMDHIWNSSNFPGFVQGVQNQSTPGTAEASSISNTVVFTGSDATFANALATAVPEASTFGLIGLAGLALLPAAAKSL